MTLATSNACYMGEGGLPVIRNEVRKAWEQISLIRFHNGKGEVIDAELQVKYGTMMAVPRRQPGDNIPRERDEDYRWSTDVNSEGWYPSHLAGFSGYFFTATATEGHDGSCSVAIRFSDEWNEAHSRPNSDMKWVNLDRWNLDTKEWDFRGSPRDLMEKGKIPIPDWLPTPYLDMVLSELASMAERQKAAEDRLVGQRS